MSYWIDGMYIAHDERLKDQRAMLRADKDNPDNYLAQFNDLRLEEAFGWHSLPKTSFKLYLCQITLQHCADICKSIGDTAEGGIGKVWADKCYKAILAELKQDE